MTARGPPAPQHISAVPPARRAALRRRLLAWYDAARRDLPWRTPQGQADPYRAWLAEVMLQQTRVEAALPYYRRFLERFPSLPALAGADQEQVLEAWAGLGYYARGRNLLLAARQALARHGGLPADLSSLRALPGFGPYTAGAVASIVFGIRAPAVDGNAARVLARLFRVEGRPEAPAARRRIAALAEALVPEGRPGDWNQALMELGATVCGRSPACARCPVAALCLARRAGAERRIPPARRRARVKLLELACAVIQRRRALLMVRSTRTGPLRGLWELPSAEVAGGEDPRASLRRSLRQLGVSAVPDIEIGAELGAVDRELTHRRLRLVAYACRASGVPTGVEFRWVGAGVLDGLAVSAAVRSLLAAISFGPPRGRP